MRSPRARFLRQLLLLGIVIAITSLLNHWGFFESVLTKLQGLSLLLALVAGFFFVSIFTVVPAGVALFTLAGEINPILVAFVASVGAVLGDYLLFRLFRDSFFQSAKELLHLEHHRKITALFHSQRFHWFFVIAGAVIIASPFPDEAGLALLGASHLSARRFIPLAFLLDFIGILLLTLAGST